MTEPTVGEEMGVTLGNDFRLANTKADPRESDLTEPNALAGDMASTAGPGGDAKHREATAHETKGLRQRLENDDEREDREARGYDEPINRMRQVSSAVSRISSTDGVAVPRGTSVRGAKPRQLGSTTRRSCSLARSY